MSRYNLETITVECNAIAKKFNRTLECPVSLNGRLRTTLGRVQSKSIGGNAYTPVSIEFSKTFVENASDAEVLETVRHEMAHWLVTVETGEVHHHDVYWKNAAIRCGAKPEATYDMNTAKDLASTGAIKMAKPKYSIYCQTCHKLVATRTRACKLTTNSSEYYSTCCHSSLFCVKEF